MVCEVCLGGSRERGSGKACEQPRPFSPACNCHGHAHDCFYDPEVDRRNASQNLDGAYQGGGVCIDCQVGWGPDGN